MTTGDPTHLDPTHADPAKADPVRFDEARQHDAAAQQDASFFGHPRGLATLFSLELWERFSYLGFQAILALYFADAVVNGGLGYSQATASSLVAAYGALVYLLSVVGAWIADRISGTYRAVLWGGLIIATGHIAMGIPAEVATWIGLGLIVIGTGLLKPNVSTMVGELYSREDERRDSGFAIYYAGINIGAFLGPLVAGGLGQGIGWHWGFGAAAVGMILGLLQYVRGSRHLAGRTKGETIRAAFTPDRHFWGVVGLVVAVVAIASLFAALSGASLTAIVNAVSILTMVVPIAYFALMYASKDVTPLERRNLGPYAMLLGASVLYNMLYFQVGNTLNFLALEETRNTVLGFTYPSTWYVSITAIVEILMGPVLAALWLKMGRRQPHVAAKVGIGVALGGVAFGIVAIGTTTIGEGILMAGMWLVVAYIFIGLGDLVLQTSGMSATTKLAPRAFASQTMALWFMAMALSQGIQAQVVKAYETTPHVTYFGIQAGVAIGYGLLLILLTPWLSKRMHSVG